VPFATPTARGRRGWWILAAAGLAVGLAIALGSTHLMSSLLFTVGARDPVTFAVTPLVLLSVAVLACALPAMRAIRVDPAVALRAD
jgi:putative ABC transport system permease protein